MGFRDRLVALYFDGIAAIRQNSGRLISFFVFVVLGIIIGIWYGNVVASDALFFWHFQNRIIYVIAGQTSFLKYLFLISLEFFVIVGIFFLLSLNYYASFLSYLLFIYKGYILAYNTVILLAAAKLTCLPFILLCYLPFSFAIIICHSLIALRAAIDSSYAFSSRCTVKIGDSLRSLSPLFLVAFAICFIESILTFILTAGIIL